MTIIDYKKDFALICISGFNVDDYRESTGKIQQMLKAENIYATSIPYKADTVRQARKKNPDIAARIQERYELLHAAGFLRVGALAHSNGNASLRMAYDRYQTPFDVTFHVQAALPSALNPYPTSNAYVFWNSGDEVVRLGKWLTFVTKIISKKWAARRNWGEMGRTGYTGTESNVGNIETRSTFDASGHSGIFRNPKSAYALAKFIKHNLRK